MKRIFKILLGLIVAVVLLLVVAGVVLPMIYDTEDLKQAIAGEVKDRTGRKLTINGALDFSVFPWVAVEVADLSLGNAAGFGDTPFAKIEQARVGVALTPLFRKQISVDEITLDGLDLSLAVNAQGQNNWDDLSQANTAEPAEAGPGMFSSQRIAGLNIRNSRIELQDQQAGSHDILSNFSMKTGPLGDGKPVALTLSTKVEDLAAGSKSDLEMATIVAIDLEKELYTFKDFELILTPEEVDGSAQAIRIEAPQMVADLAAQTLQMPAFSMTMASLRSSGELSASQILDNPAFKGTLTVDEFSPSQLMQELQMDVPATADPTALQKASIRTSFTGNSAQLNMPDFELDLDQSHFNGEVGVQNFDLSKVSFNLSADQIDLDRYLEPTRDDAAADAVAMPRQELQGQDIQGQLKIGQLRLAGLDFTNARVGVAVRNGELRLNPLTADFYGGTYSGDIKLDGSGSTPVLSLDERIDSITFQRLVADLVDTESLSGLALGHLKLTGRGANSTEVLSSLGGELGLTLTDGALEGINIWHEIRTGMAKYKGLEPPPAEPNRTVFSRMQLAALVENGVANTRELVAELPFLTVRGEGSVDLGQSRMDLRMVAKVRNAPELAGDPLSAELAGKSLPFLLSGSLDDPSVSLDWEALMKSEATGVLLKKLGLAPSADTVDADADHTPPNTADTEEDPSSEDQVKEAAKGALFKLLQGKDKDEDKENEGQ